MPKKVPHEESLPQEVEFKYVFKDDYNPQFANGVTGGITPSNEIVANFFFERIAIPYREFNRVKEGKLAEPIKYEPHKENPFFVRYITGGVTLSPGGAKAVYRWLGKQIIEVEKRIGARK